MRQLLWHNADVSRNRRLGPVLNKSQQHASTQPDQPKPPTKSPADTEASPRKPQASRPPKPRTKPPAKPDRRAELIAVGRRLFARTSYDALSLDDIARQAGVAKGLIYYYFTNKRGYYLAVVEDSVSALVSNAEGRPELQPRERVLHTLDYYLRFARGHEAAYRTIVSGGVGFDKDVLAIRTRVRTRLIHMIALGAYGTTELAPVARTALTGWLSYVEGATLDWLEHEDMDRDLVRTLLLTMLLETLRTIERFAPEHPAPSPAHVSATETTTDAD